MNGSPDPGLVGIMLRLKSPASAEAMLAEFPFEPTYQETDSSSEATRIGIPIPDGEGINAAIGSLTSAIDGLSEPAAKQWGSITQRVLDVGLTNRPGKAVSRFEVSSDLLGALGRLRITLVLSWYWPQAAYQKDDVREE